MRTFKFYRDTTGWYVDLPEWMGERWELQMVMGADTFLDLLAQDNNEIYVILSTEHFDGCETLHYMYDGQLHTPELGGGAWYELDKYMGLDFKLQMWLCDVTKFVFGDFPNKIYFK
jgi:hypothetical protein